jgi:hypothetical protein
MNRLQVATEIDKIIDDFITPFPSAIQYFSDKYLENHPNLVIDLDDHSKIPKQHFKTLLDSLRHFYLRNKPRSYRGIDLDHYTLKYIEYFSNKSSLYTYIIKKIILINVNIIKYASDEIKNDPSIMLYVVSKVGTLLDYGSDTIKDNEDIVRRAIKCVHSEGAAFQYASNRLRNNFEITIMAIEQDANLIVYASDVVRNDPDIMEYVVSHNGLLLEFGSDEIKNNDMIVLIAVQCLESNGCPFEFASDRLRGDFNITMEAITLNSDMLKFASDELKDNELIVRTANSIANASDRLRNDYNLLLDIIQFNPFEIYFASESLKDNPSIINAAILRNSLTLEFASDRLRGDRQIVNIAVISNGLVLEYVSDSLRNDFDIVKNAVLSNGKSLEFASDKLQNNRDIVSAAVSNDGRALKYASNSLRDDLGIVETALMIFPVENIAYSQVIAESFNYISDRLRLDYSIVLKILLINPWIIQYVDDKLKMNLNIMFTVIHKCLETVYYYTSYLQKESNIVYSSRSYLIKYFIIKIMTDCKNFKIACGHSNLEYISETQSDTPTKKLKYISNNLTRNCDILTAIRSFIIPNDNILRLMKEIYLRKDK